MATPRNRFSEFLRRQTYTAPGSTGEPHGASGSQPGRTRPRSRNVIVIRSLALRLRQATPLARAKRATADAGPSRLVSTASSASRPSSKAATSPECGRFGPTTAPAAVRRGSTATSTRATAGCWNARPRTPRRRGGRRSRRLPFSEWANQVSSVTTTPRNSPCSSARSAARRRCRQRNAVSLWIPSCRAV